MIFQYNITKINEKKIQNIKWTNKMNQTTKNSLDKTKCPDSKNLKNQKQTLKNDSTSCQFWTKQNLAEF